MPFLNFNFDLSGSPFTQEDLNQSRTFWTSLVKQLDSAWLKKPKGYLGRCWLDNGPQAMSYLILLGQVIELALQGVTENSKLELLAKVKQLLRFDAQQYAEVETELLAMKILLQKFTPLTLKPLVPKDLVGSSSEPRSPDLSVELPNGEVFFEITVLHIGIFDEWDKAIDQFTERIGRTIMNRGARRLVGFKLPIAFRLEQLSTKQARVLVDFILETEQGYLNVSLQNCDVYLDWTHLPHIDTQGKDLKDAILPEKVSFATCGPVAYVGNRPLSGTIMPTNLPTDVYAVCAVSDPGYLPAPAYAIVVKPSEEELSEQILKSLRNTLKSKRTQFTVKRPYVLVMKLGHHRIPEEMVKKIIIERIWNNPEHDWMSGICLFDSGDLRIGAPGKLLLIPNPKAEVPVPNELMDVFSNHPPRSSTNS